MRCFLVDPNAKLRQKAAAGVGEGLRYPGRAGTAVTSNPVRAIIESVDNSDPAGERTGRNIS
jgi:hypothetical protein